MKQQLRQIYDDLSNGRLSQREALERIKAIKQQEQQGEGAGTLLAAPVWQASSAAASAGVAPIDYSEHHVVLCELSTVTASGLEASLPDSHYLSLSAGPQQTLAERYGQHALACFERIRTILHAKPRGKVLVQIVVADHQEQALFAGLSGLLKTASLENPQLLGQLILVPAGMSAAELSGLLQDEKRGGLDPLVRHEAGARQVLRWQELAADAGKPPVAFHDHGVYLITGGLGSLGVLFAREILTRTNDSRVVLTGRAALTPEKQAVVDGLCAQPGRVSFHQLDLGDLSGVQQVIAAIREEHGRLDGVLHCAGTIADNFILKKTGAELLEVLGPKVTGTSNLDLATRDLSLDFFVLFSSVIGAMGNVGQADYATANAFLDQFAAYRNRQVAAGERHGRTRSINWPAWEAGAMGADPVSREQLQQATGIRPMRTATGLETFYRSLASASDQLLVAEGDVARIRRALHTGQPIQPEPSPADTVAETAAVAAVVAGDNLAEKTEDYLRRQCAELLKLPFDTIDPQAAMERYGIDSILAMKLTNHLEKTFGTLSKTLFFEYQTIRELAAYFVLSQPDRLAALFPRTPEQTKSVETPAEPPAQAESKPAASRRFSRTPASDVPRERTEEPIAIIGLSGRYPEAVDLDAYWQNLAAGKDCIIEVPKERWDWREYFTEDRTQGGHHYSKWGGFIAGVDEFDPQFFNISPKEARFIDPQERLFLQHAWMAVEDAGYTRASLQASAGNDLPGQVGVYAGVMYTEYQLFGDKTMGVAPSGASIANRVSYALNLHGPSVTLDTMCSSSLTAIHFACLDLQLGRTSMAIAGGVNVSIHPNKYLFLSAGQFISSDGRCQSFGQGGDGYIPAEGVGVAILKRLADAQRDGDHIYGIIRGSALNHGGKTNGYTVPNPQAQASVITRAIVECNTDPRHISYLEAHGTGTKLGDPIEIAALSKAFQQQTTDTGFCLIGSAKSNIGHCESAAGIAGLTKVLLQMRHRQIVPSLHSAELNPHIDFARSPFVVNQSLRTWEQPVVDGRTLPRIAGISSFGAGGSNAHMVIEEYPAPASQRPAVTAPVAIVLAARTPEQLRQKAVDLLQFVRERQTTIDLVSMAYTLQVGREALDERLGFIVSSVDQLVEKLEAHVAGRQSIEDVYSGQVKRNKDALSVFTADADLQQTVGKWISNGKLSRLVDLWVKGLELDWLKLYGQAVPQRMSLPTYPFARERYWVDVKAADVPAAPQRTIAAVLHPLLHGNTSDLSQQSYTSTFRGDEAFLNGRVLPAAAYLEMARVAVEKAARSSQETFVELRNVVWAEPFVADGQTPVSIAVLATDPEQIGFEIFSGAAGQELVHCQGHVVPSRQPAPETLDLEQLERRQGSTGTLVRLPRVADASADYVLYPGVVDGALEACGTWLGEPRLPFAIDALRILAPCTAEMAAWIRPAQGSLAGDAVIRLDLDLCDSKGTVCAQLQGVSLRRMAVAAPEPVVAPAIEAIALVTLERKEIVFVRQQQAAPQPVARKKAAISLAAPSAVASGVATPAPAKPAVTLTSATQGSQTLVPSAVRLYDCGNGIFSIEIAASRSTDAVGHVLQALERVQQEASAKVLMLGGIEHCFLHGGRTESNEAVERKFFHALASFPRPVVAVLQGDVIGAGFLAAALCDFLVVDEDAQYGYTDRQHGLYPTDAEAAVFAERFGKVRAQDFLTSSPLTGRELWARGWTCPVVSWEQVETHAQQLAATLAANSQASLQLLKQHLTRRLAALVSELGRADVSVPAVAVTAQQVLAIKAGTVADLVQALAHPSDYKAIVLAGDDSGFLQGAAEEDVLDVQRAILDSEIPVIAALNGNAAGNAWLLAQLCDAAVYSGQGRYSAAEVAYTAIFEHRFGSKAAREILLTGTEYSGDELQRRVGALAVVERDRVLPTAIEVAATFATLPRTTLASWKQQAAEIVRQSAATPAGLENDAPQLTAAPAPIRLQSNVVTATAYPDGIVVVKMEDRDAKNMFSAALVEGIREVFAHIEQTPAYKVVVLTGYDSYFASGGTKETLLAIQQGTRQFTDDKIFQAALDCRLPVIAAMQGHGLGAGWCLGMFADLVVLSEESRYVSPYMGYGFTPGAGATHILPETIGQDLAIESLLTAQPYTGRELLDRGITLRVLPRSEVLPAAMALAKQIAQASRGRLAGLKQQWADAVRETLEETYRLELAMHEQTFVGRADTLAQIETNFLPEAEAPAVAAQAQAAPAEQYADDDLLPAVTATLRTLLATELLLKESDIDENAQFIDLGLDSIGGVSWIRKINEKYRTSIEAVKVYSYPTLAQLSRHVAEEAERNGTLPVPAAQLVVAVAVAPKQTVSQQPIAVAPAVEKLTSWRGQSVSRFTNSAPVAPAARPAEAIAVIGMAGQFPQANDVDAFWKNIAEGRNCISEIPSTRWDVKEYYRAGDAVAGKTNSQWLGALEEYDLFDPLFFNISPAEAELMDPQQRLFLQACWHSIENAGYAAHSLSGSKCGVFVGASAGDYHQQSREHQLTAQGFTGSATSILAARISYHLNLQGPCISIDTACSSSLVAIADACDSLLSGDSDVALAGGVCVLSGPDMHIKTAQAGMLSPEGRCFTFDQRADGFVPGEGVGVVVLKRLADAQRDQDNIFGVIQGWGVNQDGKTNGITAPNPESQTRLEQHVYDKYRIDPANIQLIEAHGTGTKLGDPIEVDGLKQAFSKYTQNKAYCALGSVKSNIGHTLTAAGIAGVIKLLLALKHKQLPPTINFERINEHIDLKDSPFYVNGRLQEWKLDGAAQRQAAISSFGFSGTNAHLVVGEYLPETAVATPVSVTPMGGKFIIPLSARTVAQLQQKAVDLLGFLRQQTVDLAAIAYTLQVGREAMEERLGVVASSVEQLAEKLQAFVSGRAEIKDLYRGQVKAGRESLSVISQDDDVRQMLVDKWVGQKKLSKLTELWVKGLELDWHKLYGEVRPRRVSLPNYPFAKEHYWIETTANKAVPATASAAVLHPLVHSNSSDFSEQRFSSKFSGSEFFLADHQVKGTKVLPGVCYLEMARAAAMASAPEHAENASVLLSNVTWMSPVVVDQPREIHIALYEADHEEIEYEIYSAGDDSEVIHSQGRVHIGVSAAADDRLDWSALRAGCDRRIEAADCYAAFRAAGIEYGPAHRGLRNLSVGRNAAGEQYVLAEVELPQCVTETREQFGLHPSLMDSALQAALGFVLAEPGSEAGKPILPFAVEQIEVVDRSPVHGYVYLRPVKNERRHDHTGQIPKLDIDICDADGRVCVRLSGFTTRVLERELLVQGAANAAVALVPRWDAELSPAAALWPSQESRVLLVGGTAEQQQAIQARYPNVMAVELSDGLVERVQAAGAIEHVLWLTPASEVVDVTDERLLHEQEHGVLGGLRLIKALLRLGYESKDLGWTIVTWQTQAVARDEYIRPSHASVHGMVGSLAKEYTRWKVRLADLPLTGEWPLDELLSLPADADGNAWAFRAGEWFRQHLLPCEFPAAPAVAYRQGGVYVVIGGAGGIGEAFSEHLIRSHQARMVWIGRRELNADIQAKIDRLAAFGPAPLYLSADATDRDALAQAYRTINARHGRIDGLVHAAIDLSDKSLAQMDEARFRASLTAKTDVSVRMAQVFADAQLDFVVFFSSMGSFTKSAGQSNYGAGCTFSDAFAHRLSQVWSSPVKIMNWGYWGNTGIVASAEYRARMAQNGIGSIDPAEGMAALEGLLAAPVSQVALFKGQPRIMGRFAGSRDRISIAKAQAPAPVHLSPRTNRTLTVNVTGLQEMERLMARLLFGQLRTLGLFDGTQTAAWKQQIGLPAIYDRWLEESVRVLVGEGYVTSSHGRCNLGTQSLPEQAVLWSEWDARKAEWLDDAGLGARARLVDATLRALPDILTGKRRATDIVFPNCSLALVEDVYKHDGAAEYFNAVLADAVVEYVTARRAQDPAAKVRIIELGAGTGGTSEGVFRRLAPHADAVAEYCYTDISKAFLMHAEEAYGPTAPYLTTRLVNVEQPLAAQGIEVGSYDLAIAANVLHATKNIRRTLRNAKAALKRNGVLVLNEALGRHLLAHLTFGLLEGWWLYEDVALRITGTPTVSAEGWQRVLEAEGFRDVLFPAQAAHGHSQQIIAATGDGVIRQSLWNEAEPTPVPQPVVVPKQSTVSVQPAVVRTAAPAASGAGLREKATVAFKKVVGQALKLPVQQIDATEPLETYGIDSILVLRLVDALSGIFDGANSTVFFEYRTINALVSHFLDTEKEAVIRWVGASEPVPVETTPVAVAETRSLNVVQAAKPTPRRGRRGGRFRVEPVQQAAETQPQDIAIIGLSGRYPEAVDLDAYWINLRDGKDCITEVPKERWDWREYFSEDRTESGRHYSKFGGFIEGVDEFDPIFFNIAPKEAKVLDPQERLFLQHAWMAIEDAGYTRAALQVPDAQDLPGQVGVYVGVMYTEYQLLAAEASLRGNRMAVAPSAAGIANRVSSVLNLHGPSVTLDTMCSSSLTALHFACQDLKLGRTTLAIAGGVNVSVHANKYLLLSANQFLSTDGRCQSFGSTGDGFIPGEGVGAVVLKRLADAERDGDHIYGIIRGSALNHGGKTNGYTVPSPQAQSSVISRVLTESRIDPRHISYIEAHGTGTTLGDPIEIAALTKAFQKHTTDSGFCLIGSAKSNIGHCESAAAVAGLTKVLLQMQHGQIVPSLHSAQLNPHIDFAKTPFIVNQTLRPWEQPVIDGRKLPRIAGISSFGAGGSNAHMIVEEYPQPARQPMTVANVVIVLSARTSDQLQQRVRDLLGFVRPRQNSIDLVSIAYTLQMGREAMDERLAFVVGSCEELIERLEAYLAGETTGRYRGQVKCGSESVFSADDDLQETIDKWFANQKLAKLADLWVNGLELDWSKLYGEARPRRVSLPTYPFARERHWIDVTPGRLAAAKTNTVAVAAVLHPLVQRNTSNLKEQRFSSTFAGDELFVTERRAGDGSIRKTLSAAAYLEMARAAIEHALPERPESLELLDVVWAQEPVVFGEGHSIDITVSANGDDEVEFEIYSRVAGQETVLCQGRAAVNQSSPAPARVDVAGLAHLHLPKAAEETAADFILHPSLIEAGLSACAGTNEPFALDSLRVVSACTREMVASVRYGADGLGADLDLCDAQGNVCVQIRGIRWQQAATVEAPVVKTETAFPVAAVKIPVAAPAPRPVPLAPLQPVLVVPPVERKRVSVSLAAPGAPATAASASARPLVTLASPAQGVAPAAPSVSLPVVSLNDHGNGVFALHVASGDHPARSVIAGILQAMERVQHETSAKVLTISGFEHAFDYDTALGGQLYRGIVSFPCPVVAVLRADAIGAGFLFAALCDFLVCSEDARFGYTDVRQHLYPTSAVAAVFRERFGGVQAEDLLFVSSVATGRELRAKGWTNPIVPASEVAKHAQELATALAGKSREALHLLKQHLSRRLGGLVDALIPVEAADSETADASTPGSLDATHLRLERPVESVLSITMLAGDIGAQLAELDRVFAGIQQDQSYKAVVLASEYPGFLPDGIADSVIATFQRLLVGARVPVVAALDQNASGNAWLVSQFCDATVYSRQGIYSATGVAQIAPAVFTQRFGSDTARQMLLTGGDYSGAVLQQRTGTLLVAEETRVLSAAIDLAGSWARLPRTVLASWKQHTEALLRRKLNSLAAGWEPNAEDAEPAFTAATPIALESRVVTATVHPGGIVVVTMHDHEAKNLFSYAFNEGIREVFAHIERTPAYKVVILTGYDQYFASGGTKENLLAIQSGEAKFTDSKIFQLPLDCRLPVIAAMQGHGIGGGWSLGMFADLVLLSEESRYVSPYMDYGFTPGAGATWILAEKIGEDLARESLLTAQSYTGSALKARGLQLPVLPRAEVVAAALALAQQIARAPRGRLIALKQQLTQSITEALEETYRLELAMHEKTFVGRSDTLARIETSFHQEAAAVPVVPQPVVAQQPAPQPQAAPAKAAVRADGEAAVRAALKVLLADELQMGESDIDDHAAFVDLGLDSINGVSWVRKINAKYQTTIEATKVYVYPTLIQLSKYVTAEAQQHGTLASEAVPVAVEVPAAPIHSAPPQRTAVPARSAKQLTSRRGRKPARVVAATSESQKTESQTPESRKPEPIAIIGMAGQFPQARNVDEFWQNLAQGRNCITAVSPERWDVNAYYQPGDVVPGKTNSQWLGALEDYARFDPLFFNISPTEAEYMDPQQRLFLQACWHSIENAGYDARSLSGSRCGVFVGAATGDYHQLSRAHQLSALGFTGTAVSILAARISYFLNLQGPCVSIDTACSSSLVAMAQACDSLISRDSDLALAGGVYVMAGPEMHIRTAQAGMLSTEGRCFSFDQRADGFVMGEGVGVVVLKRLSDAQRDQDVILGLIEGWGVNQDGKTNGITAPNPESQTRLEQEVYEKYQIDPAGIQLIEAHGTATKLGDPIEVEGLKLAFSKFTRNKQYCALGSVKSNIGHTLTSAGAAGVIKLLQALKHKQLPPTINFERLNEHIDLTDSPFYVNTELQDWQLHGAATRRAAISSFGFSGTNAHLVIGEYVAPAAVGRPAAVLAPDAKAIVPLSARTAEQLRQKAADLLAFLRGDGKSAELLDVAYTLQVGRMAMDERLAFAVSSVGELTEKLQAFVDGQQRIEGSQQSQVRRNKEALALFSNDSDFQETIDKWIANRRVAKLLELWVKGLELDWTRLYGEAKPRRINLPVYPFARERYWIDLASIKQLAVAVDVQLLPDTTTDPSTSTAAAEDSEAATLLATPVWQTSDFDGSAESVYAEHHVMLCQLRATAAEQLQSVLPLSECHSLDGGADEDLAERYSSHALACFERIQVILQSKPKGRVLVQIVVADEPEQVVLAGLSALLKTAALENPQFTGQLLLVDAGLSAAELSSYLEEEKRHGLDPVIRYEQGVRQVLRWEGLESEPDTAPIAFKEHGVYLITGGMGGLGLVFAKEILEQTSDARVVLTGRAPWTLETEARLDALTTQAGRLSYRQVDLTDRDEVEQLIAGIREEYRPLSGILHCAGMAKDNVIVKKSYDEFRQVLAPKVTGTFHLDQASRNLELDFFVLFSSIAAAVGNAGQADYATANAFMDQFAAYRNRQVAAKQGHGRTRSINWSLWEAGGMELDRATLALVQQATGMQPLRTATGLEAFYRSLVLPYDQLLVVEGSTEKFASYLRKARIFEAPARTQEAVSQPVAAKPAVSLGELQQTLKTLMASVLGIDPPVVDVEQPFVELGLDSFLGAELIVRVNKTYGTDLSHLRLFDYSTVKEFAQFLAQEIAKLPVSTKPAPAPLVRRAAAPVKTAPAVQKTAPAPRRTTTPRTQTDDKVAIVGMSGRYPKANDLSEYWENLSAGRNAVGEVPSSRWDVNRYFDTDRTRKDRTYSKWLGAVDDVDRFDPLFFRISPQEAEYIDPQHRLFLQESYRAFEDAGYSTATLSNTRCGVYLGISTNDYMSLLSRNGIPSAPVTSNSYAIAAARIAYYLNLKGPAMSVDTACSSSLVAIHLASQALLGGEIDMALTGGVSLWLTPDSYVAMSQAGMFSPAGQCKTFDDGADGIVNGEGIGALVLKRLSDAQADGDTIYGVILGSGINQDGRTNGITAPSVNSQIELERALYARFGIDPETITYVETHGTGTRLGDPIELEALATVFQEKTTKKNYCALGSVKSNIGHTTAAAGVAGVQKVLLSLRHRTLVPTLHVTKENSRFDFRNSPFYVSRETKPWDVANGVPRRAAVSSFGFSGTNAHLVIEEYPAPAAVSSLPENTPVIVPLSARTPEALRQRSRDLLQFLRTAQQPVDLAALAYTLQTGREPMEERLGLVVSSVGELIEKLGACVSGQRSDGVLQGRVEPGNEGMTFIGADDDMRETIEQWIGGRKLLPLLDLWTRGLDLDWSRLYAGGKPRRVSLPTYPFAKERCWIDVVRIDSAPAGNLPVPVSTQSIEDIVNRIGDDTIDSDDAVQALRLLV